MSFFFRITNESLKSGLTISIKNSFTHESHWHDFWTLVIFLNSSQSRKSLNAKVFSGLWIMWLLTCCSSTLNFLQTSTGGNSGIKELRRVWTLWVVLLQRKWVSLAVMVKGVIRSDTARVRHAARNLSISSHQLSYKAL